MNDMAGLRRHWAAGGIFGVASLALLATPPAANSATNLVTNGDFEINGGVGQIGSGVSTLSSWTSTVINDPASGGFAFVVDSSADSSGFPSKFTPGSGKNIYLWGPGTPPAKGGSINNGFTGSLNGGSFLGISAGYGKSKVSQIVSGLTAGNQYTLAFEYAGSQFANGIGSTKEALGNRNISAF